jgi:hypothetical protein
MDLILSNDWNEIQDCGGDPYGAPGALSSSDLSASRRQYLHTSVDGVLFTVAEFTDTPSVTLALALLGAL